MLSQDAEHKLLFDLIGEMLEYDPAKRITLREALKRPFFYPLKKTHIVSRVLRKTPYRLHQSSLKY